MMSFGFGVRNCVKCASNYSFAVVFEFSLVAVWDKYLVEVSIWRDRGQEPSHHRFMTRNRIGNHTKQQLQSTITKQACSSHNLSFYPHIHFFSDPSSGP